MWPGLQAPAPPPAHLERAVCGEVQREARVGEEEVQAPKVEQVVLANLAGKHLEGAGVHNRVQQHHLGREQVRGYGV